MRAPLVLLALLAALWVVSALASVHVRVVNDLTVGRVLDFTMTRGGVRLSFLNWDSRDATLRAESSVSARWAAVWPSWWPKFTHHKLLPPPSTSTKLFLPLWCLIIPVSAWFIVAVVRRHRTVALCPCGYDARGFDVCPECGRDVKA